MIIDDNKLYIENKKDKEVIELIYNQKEKILVDKEKTIAIQVKNITILLDKKENKIMGNDSKSIFLRDLKKEYNITIKIGLNGYEFYNKGIKVIDNKEMIDTLNIIKEHYKEFYQLLSQDPIIQQQLYEYIQEEKENKNETQQENKLTPPKEDELLTPKRRK